MSFGDVIYWIAFLITVAGAIFLGVKMMKTYTQADYEKMAADAKKNGGSKKALGIIVIIAAIIALLSAFMRSY